MLTRRGFVTTATAAAVTSLGVTGSGFATAQSVPALRRATLKLGRLPRALDGLTILQISDVHAGPYMPVERMQRIRRMVSALPADLIVFTGDQIDRRPVDAGLFAEGFRGLSAPLGVYGVLGNHDHHVDLTLAESALTAAGITPLVNRSVTLNRGGQRLALVGVDDLWSPHGGPDFSLLGKHPGAFRICLCHQPQGWRAARAAGAHLTISGHTHGGQIALPTRSLNVARLTTRYIAGAYRHAGSALYVSRGIGVGAVPIRVGSPPELDVITLLSAAEAIKAA